MRAFLVLACAALAYGRPEPPVGYSYSAPSNKYIPSEGYASSSLGGFSGLSGISGGHSSSSSSGLSFGGGHSSGGISLSGNSLGGGFNGRLEGGNEEGISGGDAVFGGFSGAQIPIVQKHIYVHVPPPEPQEQRAPQVLSVAPPQKHYKIIFIKAPTPPTPVAPVIPVQPQNEEKTLVYVLVKKPEEQPDIVIPPPAPTQPSKPEVYFIKYQTQKESGGIGGGAIGGGAIGGGAFGGGISGGSIGGGELGSIGSGSGIEASGGAGGHGGAEISTDFGASVGDGSASIGGHSATSSQYGPPGHVPGSLH